MPSTQNSSPSPRAIWFPAKTYGWGWGAPVAWQGWVVLGVWTALVAGVTPFLAAGLHWIGFTVFLTVMAAALIAICYAKGEPPRWRWGK